MRVSFQEGGKSNFWRVLHDNEIPSSLKLSGIEVSFIVGSHFA
ncbi:MAG TPA: hypothetical protein VKC60_18415 [Opitutaceae bacterium]|nr:hypothetical protein [Opitutaceae bacterium]